MLNVHLTGGQHIDVERYTSKLPMIVCHLLTCLALARSSESQKLWLLPCLMLVLYVELLIFVFRKLMPSVYAAHDLGLCFPFLSECYQFPPLCSQAVSVLYA